MSNGDDNLVLTTLARWWLPAVNDHMTTTDPAEEPGGRFDGQLFYVPREPAANTHPLYRLYSPPDHMESVVPGEGGYEVEGLIARPFDAQEWGTAPIHRWWSESASDHLIACPDEDFSSRGYSKEGVLGFGYPRYRTNGEPRLEVAGSQVRLAANLAAGGAISRLWWNGKQFVNNYDYGRQIQIAFNLQGNAEVENPTEAGDKYGWPGVRPAGWAHGSPLLASQASGTTLTTSCHPLQWTPDNFGGGVSSPVMWRGTISKQLDLEWQGNPHVIRWITTVDFPHDESYVDLEVLTAYLIPEFSRFYAYDASTQQLSLIDDMGDGEVRDPSQDARLRPAAGAIMLATDDGSHALGAYRKSPLFGLGNFLFAADWDDGPACSKWNLLDRPGAVSAGSHSFEAYLLVGTRDQVVAEARRLFLSGA